MSQLTEKQRQKIAENRAKALELRKRKASQISHSQNDLEQNLERRDETISLSENVYHSQHDVTPQCTYYDDLDGDCRSSRIDRSLYATFGEIICMNCKKKTDAYDLIPKSEIISNYLLSEDSIKTLKFLNKNNPYNAGWTPMKLYLRKRVMQLSIQRFGSEEKLIQERKAREAKKFQKELEKTADTFESQAMEYKESLSTSAKIDKEIDGSIAKYNVIDEIGGSKSLPSKASKQANKAKKKRQALMGMINCITGEDS